MQAALTVNFTPFLTFWNIIEPSELNILTHLEYYRTFENILEPSGAFLNTLEYSETFLEHFGTFWKPLVSSGTFWNILEHSGTF